MIGAGQPQPLVGIGRTPYGTELDPIRAVSAPAAELIAQLILATRAGGHRTNEGIICLRPSSWIGPANHELAFAPIVGALKIGDLDLGLPLLAAGPGVKEIKLVGGVPNVAAAAGDG